MIKFRLLLVCAMMLIGVGLYAQRENTPVLDRGLVAVKTTQGVFCSWRITGEEYYDVTYNIYRDGVKLNSTPLSVSNYTDASGSLSSKYTVAAVVRGVESAQSSEVAVLSNSYLEIKVDHGTLKNTYEPNDATLADLDGDGEMELLVKFRNANYHASDYSLTATEFDIIEAYKLNGKKLWWIDCGPNMSDFQSNEINIAAYDWDGDGKAECIIRAADKTKIHTASGAVHSIGYDDIDTRAALVRQSAMQFTHTGYEYLVYFNGETGEVYEEMEFPLKRLENTEYAYNIKDSYYNEKTYLDALKAAWGDDYGHRSSKFFFGAPYLDGKHPSIFLARGIYTRHKMIAYDVDPATHKLTQRWRWDNNQWGPWYGQGYHNYTIADVDWDGRDEIVFGSMVIDDNGKGLSTTGLGHGDAHHVGDLDPYTHGQEVFACNEDEPNNNYRDATTSKVYYRTLGGKDDGRSICGNFTDDYLGCIGHSSRDAGISCVQRKNVGASNVGTEYNFRIYWDGDLCEETFNGVSTRACNGAVYKYGKSAAIETFAGSVTNNDTKNTPCLQADIFGDWREEVIMQTTDHNIRIYTTTVPTTWRNYTLLDDHQYRNAMLTQMNGYNQPPHVSYFLGEAEGMTVAPPPTIMTGRERVAEGGTVSAAYNDKHVILDATSNASYTVAEGAKPYILTVNTPSWVQGNGDNDNIAYSYYTHTLTGAAFTGDMRLVKQGDGTLVLPNVEQTYTGSTDVWAGALTFDGTMTNSSVWLNRFAVLNTAGTFKAPVSADYASEIRICGNDKVGVANFDDLTLNFGAKVVVDLYSKDNAADVLKAKKLTINKVTDKRYNVLDVTAPVIEFKLHDEKGGTDIAQGKYLIGEFDAVEGNIEDIVLTGKQGNKMTLSFEDNKLYVEVFGLRSAGKIYWIGDESNVWDLATTANFVDEQGDKTIFVSGDEVIFSDKALSATVKIAEAVRPSKVVFEANNVNFVVSGDMIEGETSVNLYGVAPVTFNNINDYTGGTYINEGADLVVSQLAYASGADHGAVGGLDSKIYLNGGTLSASGTVYCSNPISAGNGSTIHVSGSLLLTVAVEVANSEIEWSKTGTGTLEMASVAHKGVLHVRQGVVRVGDSGAPTMIIVEGGELYDPDTMYSYSGNSANVVIPEGVLTTWGLDSRCEYFGTLTGAGVVNVITHSIRSVITGDWSGFTGRINLSGVKTGQYDPELTFNNDFGLPNAEVSNNGKFNNNGRNVAIGLASGTGTFCGSGVYTFGSLNQDFTFNGVLSGCTFNKVGSGVMSIKKVMDGVNGAVNVDGGTLNLRTTAMTSKIFGDNTVYVNDGATLSGRTYVYKIDAKSGSTVRPGDCTAVSYVGYLKCFSAVINEGATLAVRFVNNKKETTSSSYIMATASVKIDGTMTVELADTYEPAAGDEFVFASSKTVKFGENSKIVLPELPSGLAWDQSKTSEGLLGIVAAESAVAEIEMAAEVECEMFDVSGVKVAEFTALRKDAADKALECVDAKGIYVVRMTDGVNTESVKVVK